MLNMITESELRAILQLVTFMQYSSLALFQCLISTTISTRFPYTVSAFPLEARTQFKDIKELSHCSLLVSVRNALAKKVLMVSLQNKSSQELRGREINI
jgi:hypothetical protein